MLPDWLNTPFESLRQDLASGSHALLLAGMAGIGKRVLAEHVARAHLCSSPSPTGACGACGNCQLLQAGTHPDLIFLEPTEDDATTGEGDTASKKGKARPHIVIDQIRSVLDRLELSAHADRGRVIIIDPADRLNASAANALLKTLEEPPAKTVFMLITAHEERLPVTVRSRCRRVPLSRPPHAAALQWLAAQEIGRAEELLRLAGGAPMQAILFEGSHLPDRWARLVARLGPHPSPLPDWDTTPADLAELCQLLQMLCVDLLRARSGGGTIYSGPNAAVIEQSARQLSQDALSDFWRALGKMKALVHHPLNGALVRDQLLLAFDRMLNQTTAIA